MRVGRLAPVRRSRAGKVERWAVPTGAYAAPNGACLFGEMNAGAQDGDENAAEGRREAEPQ